jgi:hypothetical protein
VGLLCSVKCPSNQHTNAQTRTSIIIVGLAAAFDASAVHAGTAVELVCRTLSGCILLAAAECGAGVNNLAKTPLGGLDGFADRRHRSLPFCFVAFAFSCSVWTLEHCNCFPTIALQRSTSVPASSPAGHPKYQHQLMDLNFREVQEGRKAADLMQARLQRGNSVKGAWLKEKGARPALELLIAAKNKRNRRWPKRWRRRRRFANEEPETSRTVSRRE